jgi:hypothetical protein
MTETPIQLTAIPSTSWSISLKSITLIVVSLLVGGAGTLIVRNIAGTEKLAFTTTELIGFVLSVVLSAASIVLAIAAIWMGKVTELSIIQRSDESIRLQNEVFIRTTEALQRIEASTGVTEKRIEDIIQGRVGDLSHKIADLASGRSGLMRDRASLEDQIRKSILETMSSDSPKGQDSTESRQRQLEQRNRYKAFHQALLNSFANKSNATTHKLGDGRYQGSNEDLFDVVAEVNGKKIGASAFVGTVEKEPEFTAYLTQVGRALMEGVVQQVVIAVDADPTAYPRYSELVVSSLSVLKGDPQNSVKVVCSTAESLGSAIEAINP